MATSEKSAAAKLQEAWDRAGERVHEGTFGGVWKVSGSPGLGNWFTMTAPDGTRFSVSVDRTPCTEQEYVERCEVCAHKVIAHGPTGCGIGLRSGDEIIPCPCGIQ